jgi:hypothetical protein
MTSDPRKPAPLEAPAPVRPTFDEFYIGYAPPMPPQIARFVRRAVLTIAAGVPLAASLIAIGHVRLDGGTFDYGRPRTIAGVITTRPYPAIHVDARDTQGHEASGRQWALLVAPGKHGAGALAAPFDGQRVTLDAMRIQRGTAVMLEVTPGSIAGEPVPRKPAGEASREAPDGRLRAGAASVDERSAVAVDHVAPAVHETDEAAATVVSPSSSRGAAVTLRGEIVDSKCFLGVMVPGEGKTHKDCASLCLRGGIPPAFVVRDREGRTALMLLVSESGGSLAGHEAAVRLAAEPIELTGVIEDEITPSGARARGWRMLRTNPSTWRPLGPPAR